MLTNKGAITPEGQIYDFLWESARAKVDIELGAWYAAFGIKHCLDCLSFAVLVTHEQNIAVLNNEEWNYLLSRINDFTFRYEKIYKSWSYIAEYAECLYNSRLTYAYYNASSEEIETHLEGKSIMPLYLHVFRDCSDETERAFKEMPSYSGGVKIEFKPSNLFYKKI